MRLLLIAALSICAMGIDYCIFLNIAKRTKPHPEKRWMKFLYAGYAFAVDIFIFAFISIAYRWPFYGPNSISPLPLWLAWLFFLNTLPKCAYFLLHIVSKCVGRGADERYGRWIRRIGIAFALYTAFILLKGSLYNTRHFEIQEVSIESSKIPHAFNGYKIALFSDVHLGNLSRQESFLHQFVTEINSLEADLVLFAGDLVNMYAQEITPEVAAILSQIRAPDGIFSVLGNHDMGAYIRQQHEVAAQKQQREVVSEGVAHRQQREVAARRQQREVVARQQEMGWRVLQNESVHIYRGGDSLGLCGVPYPPVPPLFSPSISDYDPLLATRLLNPSGFNMMLCHTPKVWDTMQDTLTDWDTMQDSLKDWGTMQDTLTVWGTMQDSPALSRVVDLMLSGHTHAMQLKLKICRLKWSPAKWMYRNWSGLYERDGRYLYVNEGIGYVLYPMRIGGKPEITLLTLVTNNPSP